MNKEKLEQLANIEQPEDDIYERFSEAEDFEDYIPDGYHPIAIGDKFNNGQYQVIQKLGWGHFSTVWLVLNNKDQKHYALKVQKSKESYQEAAQDELELLSDINKKQDTEEWKKIVKEIQEQQELIKDEDLKISGLGPNENYCADLVDNFVHFGMHGKHYCSVFKLVGPNLLDLITYFDDREKLMDLQLVKQITKQLLVGLVYMHEVCHQIHTDLKPENIMIQFNENNYDSFISKLTKYEKLPLSMKFLSALRENNSGKNKKKYDKKKKKKAAAAAANKKEQEETDEKQEGEEQKQQESENKENTEIQNENLIKEKKEENNQQEKEKNEENQEDEQQNKENNIKEKENCKQEEKQNQQDKKEKQEKQNEDDDYESLDSNDEIKVLMWKNDIEIPLNNQLKIQIVDFGNATWHPDHFTDNIQTREYRAPESIIKSEYEYNTDVFSAACLIFELITNNYLFKPKRGETYKKNDHHICMMIETLGKWPKNFALSGKRSKDFFNKSGNLMKIKDVEPDSEPIHKILMQDFEIDNKDANEIEDFLLPMLQIDPKKRCSARQALQSPWLWK